MRATRGFGVAALVLVGVLVAARMIVAADDEKKDDAANPYEGKFLYIMMSQSMEANIIVENARLVDMQGRRFLVGTGVGDENWQKEKSVWVAFDRIDSITVFDTVDEINDLLEESDDPTT